MKKIIVLSLLLLLSACGPSEKELHKKMLSKFNTFCIDELSFISQHGDWGATFQQVYIPAEKPENPPQPKTCKSGGIK